MIHVVVAVCSVICDVVNRITVPVSVLFPGSGRGAGVALGRGVGVGLTARVAAAVVVVLERGEVAVGAQLTISMALAKIQM